MNNPEEEKKPSGDNGNVDESQKEQVQTIMKIGRTEDGSIIIQGEIHKTELCLGVLEMARMSLINHHYRLLAESEQNQKKIIKPGGLRGLLDRHGKMRRH